MDATANLLANAERLSPYREIPNVFPQAIEHMVLNSVRTNEMEDSGVGANQDASQNLASDYTNNPFMEIPPQQRLFADNPSASSDQHGNQSSSHLLFNQPRQMHHGNAREATRNIGGSIQGRQLQGASSAPASIDGGKDALHS